MSKIPPKLLDPPDCGLEALKLFVELCHGSGRGSRGWVGVGNAQARKRGIRTSPKIGKDSTEVNNRRDSAA